MQKKGTYTAENGDLYCRKRGLILQKMGTYIAENGDLYCRKCIGRKMSSYRSENILLYVGKFTLIGLTNTDNIRHRNMPKRI